MVGDLKLSNGEWVGPGNRRSREMKEVGVLSGDYRQATMLP